MRCSRACLTFTRKKFFVKGGLARTMICMFPSTNRGVVVQDGVLTGLERKAADGARGEPPAALEEGQSAQHPGAQAR